MPDKIEKALRLLDYLTKLAWLRAKIIRDISEYEHFLWIHSIPHEQGCFTRAWGPNEEYESDVWIEIKGAREPKLPELPAICQDWIDTEKIEQTNEIPELSLEITRQVQNPAWQEGFVMPRFIERTEQLADHPEVSREMDRYIELKWFPWAEQHKKWEEVHNVYSKLFSIYQEQLRLGEQYELVLGLGFLSWRTPQNQIIKRHLVVAKAALEFEPKLAKFIVRPDPEGSKLSPEMDMLDAEQQPAHAEHQAREELMGAVGDPWDFCCIEGVLRSLIHSIHHLGEYNSRIKPEAVSSATRPVLEYAPALILRKRSVKGLTETLRSIKIKIEDGEEIPFGFSDLAEITPDSDIPDSSGDVKPIFELDDEIYFPKPSNEEQRRIVEKIRASSGVLVQGPPGTGKSHTIANLICHLLANGQRLLITAKTPRALQVLQGLLPDEIRPLCISLLGAGIDEKRSLENSVRGILNHHDQYNEEAVQNETLLLKDELNHLRKEKAEIDKRLHAIRESETHSNAVAGGVYRGTAAQIAQQISREKEAFEWFKDVIPPFSEYSYSESDLLRLLGTLRVLTPERRQEIEQLLPDALPTTQEFKSLIDSEHSAEKEVAAFQQIIDEKLFNELINMNPTALDSLYQEISSLDSNSQILRAKPDAWVSEATRDVLAGNSGVWSTIHRDSLAILSEVEKKISKADSIKVHVPENLDVESVLQGTKDLIEHMSKGGRLGWGPFRPEVVRRNRNIIKYCSIDKKPCKSLYNLKLMQDCLTVHIEMGRIWQLWDGCLQNSGSSFALQTEFLKSQMQTLHEVLALESRIGKCEEALRECGNLSSPIWHNANLVRRYIDTCKYTLCVILQRSVSNKIVSLESSITVFVLKPNVHPVTQDILKAIQKRDLKSYGRIHSKIKELAGLKDKAQQAKDLLDILKEGIPHLAEELSTDPTETYWDERLRNLSNAWRWAQAVSWLNDYIGKEDSQSLERLINQIEEDISSKIARISSNLAWSFCFKRLSEEHRRHMEAWQQSMRRLGKGTGKHAPRHRREAQKHLNECREAVPAWIMPLHRIWDTVSPEAGMFDLIIVDEASQCGPEAFPLFYIANKILIVGDDKQISPEAVGIQRDAVHRFMDEYLHDFRFKDSFDVQSSLFDHGRLRYGAAHIVLREHFRCMPEIIRFSNELCYSAEPLISLRQYPPNRLPPLRKVYVNEGYREGSQSRVFNRPEAEQIVNTIVDCCQDNNYENMTMGVITLQGNRQARLIEEMLLQRLGPEELDRRRLICGDPYSFQGDEREVIFLSMVAAPNERIGPLNMAFDERRFNVAVSRARDQVWLFHSATRNDLSTACLRRRLLEFFEESNVPEIAGLDVEVLRKQAYTANRAIEKAPSPFDSWFEVDVAIEIAGMGYHVVPQFEVAGYFIDLVVEGGQSRLAVECDGDDVHGLEQYEQDMHRQRILERCGWVFYRIRSGHFYADKEGSLSDLWQMLEERDIFPINYKAPEELEEGSLVPDNEEMEETRDPNRVEIGDTITYVYVDTPDSERQALISRGISNPDWGIINVDTPIAQALLGAVVDDVVEAITPKGIGLLQIKSIKKSSS